MWTARPERLDRVAKDVDRSFDTGRKTVCRVRRRLRGALDPGGSMRRSTVVRALVFGVLTALILPASAFADFIRDDGTLAPGIPGSVAPDTIWVILAACLVMFMQAGFAFLEIGFSRGKNAGTVVAKILTNFSIAGLCYWVVGFAFAFGAGQFMGHDGFFLRGFGDPLKAFPVMGLSDATVEAKWWFQFVFCAVSLAIVW